MTIFVRKEFATLILYCVLIKIYAQEKIILGQKSNLQRFYNFGQQNVSLWQIKSSIYQQEKSVFSSLDLI